MFACVARRLLPSIAFFLVTGCSAMPPIPTVEHVDLNRFMGDWYVIAAIPGAQEAKAFNSVETYRLRPGTGDVVEVSYSFRDGAFDGPLVTLQPVGFVEGSSGASWGMKFWWWQGPLRLEYLIADLDSDYTRTIVARSARDYVWIMARTPALPEETLTQAVAKVKALGYDTTKLRIFPQRWGTAPDITPTQRQALATPVR